MQSESDFCVVVIRPDYVVLAEKIQELAESVTVFCDEFIQRMNSIAESICDAITEAIEILVGIIKKKAKKNKTNRSFDFLVQLPLLVHSYLIPWYTSGFQ